MSGPAGKGSERSGGRAWPDRDLDALLIDRLPAAVYVCEAPSGAIVRHNRRAVELWGREPVAGVGAGAERFSGAQRLYRTDGTPLPPESTPMAEALRDGAAVAGREIVVERPDGTRRTVLADVNPLHDESGRLLGAVGVLVDVTERAEREQALRDADRRKDEFLAMLAHELRNPLASLSNAVQVAKRSGAGEHREWSQEVMESQLRHLSRLIEDLLDVSRIARGKVRLRRARLNVIPILEQALESVRPLVEERHHELSASFDHGLWVRADPTRLEQIAVNLLTNAVKYTEDGGKIRLTARREGDEVVITVTDNGVGIPPAKLPQMFEMFAQGDRSLKRSEGGLGIGLTLVKNLAELHGGRITANSEGIGRGSEFAVHLPAIAPPRPQADAAKSKPARDAAGPAVSSRILVVDDNIDTARGMGRLLRLLGHDVATAHDGPSALDAARAQRPEVVLLDIGLPGMDGYELARRLREDESSRDAMIVAVSGYGQDADRDRSQQAGIDHHLVKPIDHDALVTLLSRKDE